MTGYSGIVGMHGAKKVFKSQKVKEKKVKLMFDHTYHLGIFLIGGKTCFFVLLTITITVYKSRAYLKWYMIIELKS